MREALATTVVRVQPDQGLQWETLAGAGALLLGVVLTGLWADRRQSRALASERDRLDKQLAFERERLQQQHDHDRQLADLGEFRSLLDAATEGMSQVYQAALKAVVAQERVADDPDAPHANLRKRIADFVGSANKAHAMTGRMALRVGYDHELVSLHSAPLNALSDAFKEAADADDSEVAATLENQCAALKQFREARRRFLEAAREFVASRLPVERDEDDLAIQAS